MKRSWAPLLGITLGLFSCGGPTGGELSATGGPCARYYNCAEGLECIQDLCGLAGVCPSAFAGGYCSRSCTTNADCGAGGVCVAGVTPFDPRVTVGGCDTDTDCRTSPDRSNHVCVDGGCGVVAASTCRQGCQATSDCRTDLLYTCSSGYCRIPPECTTPADCGAATFCVMTWDCVAESCVAVASRDCSDGVDCTMDSCDDTDMACVNTPDNMACGAGETCDATAGCVPIPCTAHADCDDGALCTLDYCDTGGVCQNFAVNDFCDDGEVCTIDACDPGAAGAAADGCTRGGAPPTTACDDGMFCTVGETCDGAGACDSATGSPRCNDGDACTRDTCGETADACYHSEMCAIVSEINVIDETAATAIIEMHNLGATPRIVGGFSITAAGSTYTVPGGTTILSDGRLQIRWNAPAVPCVGVGVVCAAQTTTIQRSGGEVVVWAAGGVTSAETIRDYVEWGAAGGTREPLASQAGMWTAGTFVNSATWMLDQSIGFTGTLPAENDVATNWCVQAPTPGAANGVCL